MITGVYSIQSKIKPNRIYIGSSVNIIKRWSDHSRDLKDHKHRNIKLQRHYDKYGISDLMFSIMVECSEKDLINIEQCLIDSNNPYFNICKIAGSTLGYKHTESTINKMKRSFTEEHKNKLRNAKKGRKTNRRPKNSFEKGYIPWNKGLKYKTKASKA